MSTFFIILIVTCFIGMSFAIPALNVLQLDTLNLEAVNGENKTEGDHELKRNITEEVVKRYITLIQRLRQDDGDGGGLENVAEIVTGALGGGIGNIFQGSTSFVGDSAVQEELQFVFGNISPVVDTLLKYGWDGLKTYFGFGVTTTPKPVMVVVPQQQQQQKQPIYQQQTNNVTTGLTASQTFQSVQNVGVPTPATQQPVIVYVPAPVPTTTEESDSDNDVKAI